MVGEHWCGVVVVVGGASVWWGGVGVGGALVWWGNVAFSILQTQRTEPSTGEGRTQRTFVDCAVSMAEEFMFYFFLLPLLPLHLGEL